MKTGKIVYSAQDVAFVIPTKDRPEKINNLLSSLAGQSVICGRIVVVDGGISVKDLVMGFSERLPVEYYECDPPGQIKQRNMAIAKLDDKAKLVGILDDDIILEANALELIIKFWNQCEPDTAGISFNIINQPQHRPSRIKILLGLSAMEQGRVLKSGMTTSNSPVDFNIKTQWLCGGATMWRKGVLNEFLHEEISSRWAICEDVIFSFPVGKKYPLYVCSQARVRHEHEMDYVSRKKHRFHGKTQTLWMFHFVTSNKDLSVMLFLWTLVIRIAGNCLTGIFDFKTGKLGFSLGQVEGILKIMRLLIFRGNSAIILSDKNF